MPGLRTLSPRVIGAPIPPPPPGPRAGVMFVVLRASPPPPALAPGPPGAARGEVGRWMTFRVVLERWSGTSSSCSIRGWLSIGRYDRRDGQGTHWGLWARGW